MDGVCAVVGDLRCRDENRRMGQRNSTSRILHRRMQGFTVGNIRHAVLPDTCSDRAHGYNPMGDELFR